ncbi:MAG: MCP four helix bundle domain-containing protein [Oceanospirillaceae bacterium]
MLGNMSVQYRVIVFSMLPILSFVCILILALNELKDTGQGVNRIYTDTVVPLKDLKVVADDYAVRVIDAINKANTGLLTAEETDGVIVSAQSEAFQRWQQYMATTLTEEETKLAREASELFLIANSAIEIAHNKIKSKAGNIAGELNELDGALYASIDPISNKITELINLKLQVAKVERDLIIGEYGYYLAILMYLATGIIAILILLCIVFIEHNWRPSAYS